MKEFEKLVASPYFNKGRNYLPFLNQLKKFYPKFDNDKMTPEYIYSKMYHGKKFNQQIIWNMTSAVLNMAEEFLILNSLKKNKFTRNSCIADEFLERRLANYYSKKLDEMEKTLNNAGIGEKYFHSKSQLESKRSVYHFLEDTQHLISKHLVKKGEYAVLDFLVTIEAVIANMDANTRMFNARFDVNLAHKFIQNLNLEEVIKYAKMKNFRYAWVMEMYYYSIKMIVEQDSLKYFTGLKKLFKEHFDKFKLDEKNTWIVTLTNYCAGNFSVDEDYFRKELFEINKLQLKEVFSQDYRYFSKILFIQILRNALGINETEWAKNFIEEFIPKLKPSYQKTMCALGLAFLNFKLKNFDGVLENLRNVKFIDSRDKLNVRNLYIRTYYELNEIEAVLSQIDSTKHFINKTSSFIDKTKTNYIKSLNLLNRLINANYNSDTIEIELIRKATEEDKEIIFGNWLIEKIDELKTKKN